MNQTEMFMMQALNHAKISESEGEIPVGAVIVKNGEIIAYGRNQREMKQNALSHAEIEALNKACNKLKSWRLNDCDMYVTMEPCAMCAGAILNARIRKVIYAVSDEKCGACGSVINLFDMPVNHRPRIQKGVLENECANLIRNFFKELRE